MNVWIITTGSSDIQLKTKENWNDLCDRAKEQQDSNKKLHFSKNIELTKSVVKPKGSDRPITSFLAPARAMGIVYGNAIAEDIERYKDLDFPLFNNFSTLLKEKNIIFDKIIIFVTDQTDLFTTPTEKNQIYYPYWQDTCTFEEIIKQYFQNSLHKVEKIEPEFLVLKPDVTNPDPASNRKPGLDDWNSVLKLVQEKIASIQDIPEDATVYVSHQASTPAISSAIQFASLAKFGKQVEFLVSNVDDLEHPADIIRSGEYLRGIKFQEAKALLDRHDYAGVKDLVDSYLTPEIQILLDAAIQWNFAKFEEFLTQLESYPKLAEDLQERKLPVNWWWMAYEAAYLAIVRLHQGNTVEAMFHSFRALEGLAIKYAHNEGQDLYSRKVFDYLKRQKLAEWNDHPYIKELVRSEIRDKAIRNDILDKRNNLFHQLKGFKEEDLYAAWKATDKPDWKNRVLQCLNFISGEAFTPPLEETSLMFKVHQELVNAIAPNNL